MAPERGLEAIVKTYKSDILRNHESIFAQTIQNTYGRTIIAGDDGRKFFSPADDLLNRLTPTLVMVRSVSNQVCIESQVQ